MLSSRASTRSSATTASICIGSPPWRTLVQPSKTGVRITTTSGRIVHWARSRRQCLPVKLPDMFNFPHQDWLGSRGTVTAYYRKSKAKDQSALRLRIREIAYARPRFGYQRIHVMLRREDWPVNKKRIRRLYRLEGLQLRMRIRRRKHMCLHRGPVPQPTAPGERWSMDFVHDC